MLVFDKLQATSIVIGARCVIEFIQYASPALCLRGLILPGFFRYVLIEIQRATTATRLRTGVLEAGLP